jgi:hypothetical protein
MSWPNDDDDDDLSARFRELRDGDRARTPAFAAMRVAALAPGDKVFRAYRPALLWMAVAASVVLLAGGTLLRRVRADRRPEVTWRLNATPTAIYGAASISQWRSPTASLLRTSGSELFAPRPLLSSVLDHAAGTAAPYKGSAQ